jgi:hypothetical protein
LIYLKNSFLSISKKLFFVLLGLLNKLAQKLLNNIIGDIYEKKFENISNKTPAQPLLLSLFLKMTNY